MNVQFVNQFVKSALSLPHCPCQKDLMETLSGDIQSPETNLKRIQDLIRSSPTDLKIISEDGKVIHSHKLLFGLIISNLAKILLEDDFIGEHVTVFIPLRSAVLVKVIEEGGNWIEIQSILSTCEDDHHRYQNLKPTNSISITKLEKKETELATSCDDWQTDEDNEDKPVTIKIQKKSTIWDEENSEKCSKCEREVSNLEVHKIACEQVSNGPSQLRAKVKVTCPLCNKEVLFDYFVSNHYYKCSNWTVPGSDLFRAKYEESLKVKRENKCECPTCGKEIGKNYFVKHQETCDGVMRTHKCPNCKKKLKENFETHLIACKQLGGAPIKRKSKVDCPLCMKKFLAKFFVERHFYMCSNWSVPGSEEKRQLYELSVQKRKELDLDPVTCDECGKVLASHLALKNHIRNVHNPDNIFHHCDKCEYKCSLKSTLKLHIDRRHSIPVYLTCHICGVKLKGKHELKVHHKLKHEVQEMVKCEICGKDIRKVTYKAHKLKAHGEKKHACDLCSYRTTSSFNLKLHVSKSHMGVKELPKSKCQYCDVETTNLPYHTGVHHPDKF